MYASYGKRKCGNMLVGLPPGDCTAIKPSEPQKTDNDRFTRCSGCPYPRHGLFCWSKDGSCLRTEMAEIYGHSRQLEVAPI